MCTCTRRRCLLRSLALLGAEAALAACGSGKPIRGQPVATGAAALARGESLTHGTGAGGEAAAYPAVLVRLTGWNAVNAGVPGGTTADLLARTPPLLAGHRPALVLLGIGGNDFLRRVDEGATPSSPMCSAFSLAPQPAQASKSATLLPYGGMRGNSHLRLSAHFSRYAGSCSTE